MTGLLSSCCGYLVQEGSLYSRSIYLNLKPLIVKTFLNFNDVKRMKM